VQFVPRFGDDTQRVHSIDLYFNASMFKHLLLPSDSAGGHYDWLNLLRRTLAFPVPTRFHRGTLLHRCFARDINTHASGFHRKFLACFEAANAVSHHQGHRMGDVRYRSNG
jgi:hypothetical protein